MEDGMSRIVTIALGAALWFAGTSLGLAADSVPADNASEGSQMSDQQIRDQLAINGYTVQKLMRDGKRISVIATDNEGTTSKLLVDADTGRVKPAADDDDDDDGDGD
jgi:hypothetical protein